MRNDWRLRETTILKGWKESDYGHSTFSVCSSRMQLTYTTQKRQFLGKHLKKVSRPWHNGLKKNGLKNHPLVEQKIDKCKKKSEMKRQDLYLNISFFFCLHLDFSFNYLQCHFYCSEELAVMEILIQKQSNYLHITNTSFQHYFFSVQKSRWRGRKISPVMCGTRSGVRVWMMFFLYIIINNTHIV